MLSKKQLLGSGNNITNEWWSKWHSLKEDTDLIIPKWEVTENIYKDQMSKHRSFPPKEDFFNYPKELEGWPLNFRTWSTIKVSSKQKSLAPKHL